MPRIILPPPDIVAPYLVGQTDDTRFVSQLRIDYPLLYLDVVRALISGDCISNNRLPVQVVERVINFTGRQHTDYRVMFRLAERMLAEHPEAYVLRNESMDKVQ